MFVFNVHSLTPNLLTSSPTPLNHKPDTLNEGLLDLSRIFEPYALVIRRSSGARFCLRSRSIEFRCGVWDPTSRVWDGGLRGCCEDRAYVVPLRSQPFFVRGLESHCWFGGKGFVWAEVALASESPDAASKSVFPPRSLQLDPKLPDPTRAVL